MSIPIRMSLSTHKRNELIEITSLIQGVIQDSGVKEGICLIHNPHTTAALTINENADRDVARDMEQFLSGMIPQKPEFRHCEGNSDSHIKTTLVGPSLSLIIHEGQALLGTWQGIYFFEFDGPRQRHLVIKCLAG